MKRILLILVILALAMPAWAGDKNIERVLNDVWDDANNRLNVRVSGHISGDSATFADVVIQPNDDRTPFRVISRDGTTILVVSQDNVYMGAGATNVGINTSVPRVSMDVIGNTVLAGTVSIDSNCTVSGRLSADSITSDSVWVGGYLYPTDAPADNEAVVYDAALGRLNFESIAAAGGATTALDNLASVAINTGLISDTDNTDDLGSLAINWKTIYTQQISADSISADAIATLSEAHITKLDENTIIVSPNSEYTTIDAAINAASAGFTILVAEGTYTEAITYDVDNLTIKAIGSRENTTITQVADTVVNFSTASGCILDGFTVSITAADGSADYAVTGANDDASDYNIIRDCKFVHTSSGSGTYYLFWFTDGNWRFEHSWLELNNTYTGATATTTLIGRANGSNKTEFIDCDFVMDSDDTSTGDHPTLQFLGATTDNLVMNSRFDLHAEALTTGAIRAVVINAGITRLINNYISVDCAGTGLSEGLDLDTAGTIESYGNVFKVTNADADSSWANIAASTTLKSYGDTVVDGGLTNAGTYNPYTQIGSVTTTSPDVATTNQPTFYVHATGDLRFFDGTSWHKITLQ